MRSGDLGGSSWVCPNQHTLFGKISCKQACIMFHWCAGATSSNHQSLGTLLFWSWLYCWWSVGKVSLFSIWRWLFPLTVLLKNMCPEIILSPHNPHPYWYFFTAGWWSLGHPGKMPHRPHVGVYLTIDVKGSLISYHNWCNEVHWPC